MRNYEELFQAGRSLPPKEEDLSPAQKMARGRMMQGLMQTEAWDLLDAHVSETVEFILARIETENEPMEIKKLQGQLSGIKALRICILTLLDHAVSAKEEVIQQEQKE